MNQGQTKCPCGWKQKQAPPQSIRNGVTKPNAVLMRMFGAKHEQVLAFVKKYQQEHPGATKREACIAYMPSLKKIEADMKKHANFDDAMDSYREEATYDA